MGLNRSEQMSRILGTNTTPEVVLREALVGRGASFNAHGRTPVGRPDLVFDAEKVAVFIDGCFWHGCPVHYVRPRTRTEFWSAKLKENVTRDRDQTRALEALGWRVVRLWEHDVFTALTHTVDRIGYVVRRGEVDHDEGWRVFQVDVIDASSDLERRHLVTLRDPPDERLVDAKRFTTKWKTPRESTKPRPARNRSKPLPP